MWPKVNKDLLPMKGHYFLYNAGIAPVQSFMQVYARYLGFSSDVVGTIYSVLPVAGMLAKPFFGAVADRFRFHKFLFILFQIVTIIAFFSIQFIPEIPGETKSGVNLVCGSQMNFHVDVKNIRDKTLIEKILLASSNTNLTVKCRMKCKLMSDFQNEICYHWKERIPGCTNGGAPSGSKYENVITESNNVKGKKLKVAEPGKEVYAEKFKLSDSNEQDVEFESVVALEHTIEESGKLYFRIPTVFFEKGSPPHIPYCIQEIDTNCSVKCEKSILAELLSDNEEIRFSDFVHMYQFWLLVVFLILSWVGMAVVGSISDAICFEMLGAKAGQYGNQRLFGSIGWGIFAFLTGVIIDEFSKGQPNKNYTPIFYIMLIMLSCDVACMYSLKYRQTKLSTQILKNVGKLIQNVRVVVFLLWCIFIGICIGIQWNFLFWYIEDLHFSDENNDKKWLKTLQGLVSGIQCFLGELPSFFFSGWLLKKFGHINIMSGILFFVGVRFTLYSILTDPWWCLPIEMLQATVGLTFATMASYASIVAPPGTEATVQGLVGAIFEGIGVSSGSFLGGYIFKHYGGETCFKIFGRVAFAVFVLHVVTQYFLGRSASFKLDGKDNMSQILVNGVIQQKRNGDQSTDSSMETIN